MPSNIFDLQDTWNSGGTVFNGIKINVSNAASAVGSRLLRVDTAGVSQFAVDPVNGAIVGSATGGPQGPGTVNATAYYLNGVLFTGGGASDGDKGDIVVSSGGTIWTIDAGVVTYAKMQNVAVTGRVLGRFTAGSGLVEEGTGAQVNSLLPIFTDTLKGLVPPSGGGTVQFLRADGTFATPPGGGGGSGLADAYQVITDGVSPAGAVGAATFKLRAAAPLAVTTENTNVTHGKNALFNFVNGAFGDIVISAGAWTIGNSAVTYAKMQSTSVPSILLGRGAGTAGVIQEITLGLGLTMTGTTLAASGGGGGGGFTSSATAPGSPLAGDRWYNTDTGVTSTYINDGNSSQWVQTAPSVSPPSAAGFGGINVQTFAASGTYTPTPGMKYCQIECVGGGGGGGGAPATAPASVGGGGGGGSGAYSRKTVAAAVIGVSQPVTIGAGGTAGNAAATNAGGAGGATSVAGICVAAGGSGGTGYAMPIPSAGGAGGSAGGGTGDVMAAGAPGVSCGGSIDGTATGGGTGGSSFFGGGGVRPDTGTGVSAVGSPGSNYGGGGSGAYSCVASVNRAGGAGASGFVIITEYL